MRHHQRYFKANHRGIQLEPVFLSAYTQSHAHTCTFTLNCKWFYSRRLCLKTVKLNLLCRLYKGFAAFI